MINHHGGNEHDGGESRGSTSVCIQIPVLITLNIELHGLELPGLYCKLFFNFKRCN